MFGRVAKIPIASTFNELVEMDFGDYGDHATFLHIRDTFSRFSVVIFLGTKKREEQTAEMVRETVISNWLAVFGAPDILVVDKDKRFVGKIFQDFCTHTAILLYKRLFRDIIKVLAQLSVDMGIFVEF